MGKKKKTKPFCTLVVAHLSSSNHLQVLLWAFYIGLTFAGSSAETSVPHAKLSTWFLMRTPSKLVCRESMFSSTSCLAHQNRSDFLRLRCPLRTPEIASDIQEKTKQCCIAIYKRCDGKSLAFYDFELQFPKSDSFCGNSGHLAPSTRKSLAIAIVRFWCAKSAAKTSCFRFTSSVTNVNPIAWDTSGWLTIINRPDDGWLSDYLLSMYWSVANFTPGQETKISVQVEMKQTHIIAEGGISAYFCLSKKKHRLEGPMERKYHHRWQMKHRGLWDSKFQATSMGVFASSYFYCLYPFLMSGMVLTKILLPETGTTSTFSQKYCYTNGRRIAA